jgi:hypothetical protein
MSYDVYIGDRSFNYTSNVSKLFYDHIPDGIHALHGLTGKQAVEVLDGAFNRLNRTRIDLWREHDVGEPRFCAKYDAPNGWGSALGAIVFLAEILAACAQNPRKKVRVWA